VEDPDTHCSVVTAWDIESRPGGEPFLTDFAKGADLMIHDSCYTEDEYNRTKRKVRGFGHSTYQMALDDAARAGVGTLAFFHYNTTHSDVFLDKVYGKIAQTRRPFKVLMAREGLSLRLDAPGKIKAGHFNSSFVNGGI
jgi:hypothetical protein